MQRYLAVAHTTVIPTARARFPVPPPPQLATQKFEPWNALAGLESRPVVPLRAATMRSMNGFFRPAWALCALAAIPLLAQEPLATVNGKPILESDLALGSDWRKLEQQVYDLWEEALNSAIATRLLTEEAERRGVTAQALIDAEISPKVGAPTNAEVSRFYEDQKANINKPLNEVRNEIARILTRTKAERHLSDYVKSLWAEADVDVFLDPPRLPVNLDGVRFRGDQNAPVTIIEYSDFQCPFCRRVQPTLAELASEYEEEIRWGFKDMPLSEIHPDALRAAQAGRCADEQGKFWEFRAKLFEQDSFTDETYTELAEELRIKLDPLVECMNSGKHENAVMADFNEARSFGIDGTPAFLINGVLLTGAQRIETFRHVIDRELGVDVVP